MPDSILLTGATGYIGRYLLRTWLERTDKRIHLLARGRPGKSAASRVEQSLRDVCSRDEYLQWADRLTTHDGDVSHEFLGLPPAVYETLTENVAEIVHCAAAARFDLSLEDARRTNVGGVEHLLALSSKCGNLRRLHYVGTAYVAGVRSGRVMESELDAGQEHRNTYERSKFEAETLLRSRMADLPITIYRPSIVICDSRTGKASDHNGFYRALRMYLLGGLTVLPGQPSSQLDLVPVDYVCEAIYRIAHHPKSAGVCYHITAGAEGATTLEDIQRLSSDYSGHEKFRIVNYDEFGAFLETAKARLTDDERKIFEEMSHYAPYLFCNLWFDNSNTLRDAGIHAPRVSEYFHRFVGNILAEGVGSRHVAS